MTKAEMKQIEMLRAKTPKQRFQMMADMINAQFEAVRASIKYQNPGITQKELGRLFKERMCKIYSLKH
ncbi:MAG: hypothetical protein HY746_02040 [Elusimicrobia bacterium]|nr:hypothetical protein [Elusimicrobiota bacterium]